jgi:hypothetical protein
LRKKSQRGCSIIIPVAVQQQLQKVSNEALHYTTHYTDEDFYEGRSSPYLSLSVRAVLLASPDSGNRPLISFPIFFVWLFSERSVAFRLFLLFEFA